MVGGSVCCRGRGAASLPAPGCQWWWERCWQVAFQFAIDSSGSDVSLCNTSVSVAASCCSCSLLSLQRGSVCAAAFVPCPNHNVSTAPGAYEKEHCLKCLKV